MGVEAATEGDLLKSAAGTTADSSVGWEVSHMADLDLVVGDRYRIR
jgi:hypothetical protein